MLFPVSNKNIRINDERINSLINPAPGLINERMKLYAYRCNILGIK